MWLTWVLLSPVGGWASDRLGASFGLQNGRRIVVVGGLGISAVLVYIGTNVTATLPTVVLLCLALGFAAGTDGPYWAAAIDASGKHSGTGSAIFNTGGNLGGMLAPTLTPLIAARLGWSGGLYAGGFVALAGLMVWFFIGSAPAVRTPLRNTIALD
jgi:MFS family permease